MDCHNRHRVGVDVRRDRGLVLAREQYQVEVPHVARQRMVLAGVAELGDAVGEAADVGGAARAFAGLQFGGKRLEIPGSVHELEEEVANVEPQRLRGQVLHQLSQIACRRPAEQ